MLVEIYRRIGASGIALPLEILVDDVVVASIAARQMLTITVPDGARSLRVRQDHAGSLPYALPPDQAAISLVCGTRWWVAFDLLSLGYLPGLLNRNFFVRPR